MWNNTTFSDLNGRLGRLACSPWSILFAAGLGILCGIFFPEFSKNLSLGGEIYLNYITLLTIPLMICALSSSLASLLQKNRSEKSAISLKKMFLLLIFMYVLCGTAGIVTETAVNHFFPNKINVEQLDELFHAEEETQVDYTIRIFETAEESIQKQFSLREFILDSIPTNIFQSFSQGNALHILIFSILFGLALGMAPAGESKNVISVLSSIYQACLFLIQCSAYVLPLCLFCLLANKVSILDYSMLKMVSQFLFVLLGLEAFITVLGLILWSCAVRMPIRTLLKTEGKTMLIAVGTCQSFVVMSSLMQDMEEKMRYSPEQLKLVVPFAITMGKYTRVLGLAVTAVFVSYLYYGEASPVMVPMLLIVAPPFAIGGAWPMMAAAMLKLLGLPGELGLLLLLTINPFLEPLSTLCNVVCNGLFTSLIIKRTASECSMVQQECAENSRT